MLYEVFSKEIPKSHYSTELELDVNTAVWPKDMAREIRQWYMDAARVDGKIVGSFVINHEMTIDMDGPDMVTGRTETSRQHIFCVVEYPDDSPHFAGASDTREPEVLNFANFHDRPNVPPSVY